MRRYATLRLAAVLTGMGLVSPVLAQAPSGCENIQKLMQERQALVQQLNTSGKGKKRLTPTQACNLLGRLVNNGNATVKFATANQDWCQIPASFIDGLKADNEKAGGYRGQACNAAKQQATLERRARQQAQQQSQNPFGGPDAVTGGPMRVPQGAL
ncbi:hypothetical protein ABE438_14330 [Bosea sp. TWI1241]|jgi:hypothetical protein|uniref:hypothetical protein n=1 Tax=Bosea sp. TWI1241 TaxID=3148904 RepID=UPI003207FFF0